ncbi:nicotinamide-nucleotide amidohydrolase family protein [Bombilactobacillus folatiphilus]|uniref:Nicotinamide-nucleotide amidohydrolase family protein n=1 Tax=Bombilactobacillus folatiphilus TaxID=2923362 RepID=A0ABY4P7W4_9LACO|nr:nicotinamide-nucleotide amidohydrolase family protein [Bombilactobacillus folatiphilus]UQS81704.1 nicotinamide-nucleotide amidohydrolase family protein [Bombilactobacillus folatiphilus]
MMDLKRQFLRSAGNPINFVWNDYQPIIQETVEQLKQQQLTITAAESLTAGLFQASIAEVAGASQVFSGGFVTYSLSMKAQLLEIAAADLQHYGVVSSWTAQKMAEQSSRLVQSDFGIGLTGVAGPDRLENQEAGTVFVGVKTPTSLFDQGFHLKGSRQMIRQKSVIAAFILIQNQL